jgi:hypothetical protein
MEKKRNENENNQDGVGEFGWMFDIGRNGG